MSSVRRNLFQSQLTRRPTSGAPGSASSSSNGAGGGATPSSSSVSLASSVGGDALRLDSAELQLGPEMVGGGGLSVGGAAGYLDIVIRDKNGEIELGDPPTPGADEEDDGMAEARHESEKERQRLVDAVKQHQIDKNSLPVQPEGEYFFFGVHSHFIAIPCVGGYGVPVSDSSRVAPRRGLTWIAELLEAVRVSLRAKVAALADDNWMFEREELPRHQ